MAPPLREWGQTACEPTLIEEEARRMMAVPQAVGGHDWLVNSADWCRDEKAVRPFVYGRGEERSMQPRRGVGDPRELGRVPEREPRGELFAAIFAGVGGCDSLGQLGGSKGSLCQGNSIQGLQGLGGRACAVGLCGPGSMCFTRSSVAFYLKAAQAPGFRCSDCAP